MKKRILLHLVFSLSAFTAFSQGYPDSLKAPQSKELDYAQEVVNKLCDPSMKGRGYAKNGDKIAADYIMNEFKAIGVQPIGSTYFQKFEITANTFPEKMSLQVNGEIFMPGQEFMPDPSCPTVLGTFKPVYINRKEINDRMVLMDRLRDAKETFLVVDNSSKEGETPEMTKRINDLIEKMKTDPQVQLKGLIIHNPGKVAWSTSSNQGIRPVIYVSKEAADFSVAKEIKIAIDAEYKARYETQNVVGMIKGTAKPDSFIVVSAHYDHLGTMGSSTIYPGANNSASGVAMMLSLAKHYSIVPPKYSVIFVAFAGSELGFAGAQAFVSSPPYKLDQIKYDFNFDLVGNGIEGIKVVNGAKFEDQIKQMNKINAYYKLLPKVEPAPTRRISDHCVFDEKAIPSMFIYTLGGTVAYHNLNDTPANLPFTKFANFLNLMIRYLETIK